MLTATDKDDFDLVDLNNVADFYGELQVTSPLATRMKGPLIKAELPVKPPKKFTSYWKSYANNTMVLNGDGSPGEFCFQETKRKLNGTLIRSFHLRSPMKLPDLKVPKLKSDSKSTLRRKSSVTTSLFQELKENTSTVSSKSSSAFSTDTDFYH